MKIVQSHIINSNYENNSFYIILLNYLNLKKLYGSVTMYCNRLAYENTIKYIPFDEIIIMENKYEDNLLYKLAVIEDLKEDFIYIDTEILLFEDILSEFINNNKLNLLIQYVKKSDFFGPDYFFKNNQKFFNDNNLSKFDNNYFSTDIIGMRLNFKDKYIANVKIIEKNIKNKTLKDIYNFGYQSLIYDELLIYLTYLNNNFNYYEIFPDIRNIGFEKCVEKYKITYITNEFKFKNNIIELLKNKIKKTHSAFYNIVEKYENIDIDKEQLINKLLKTKNINIIKNIKNILK